MKTKILMIVSIIMLGCFISNLQAQNWKSFYELTSKNVIEYFQKNGTNGIKDIHNIYYTCPYLVGVDGYNQGELFLYILTDSVSECGIWIDTYLSEKKLMQICNGYTYYYDSDTWYDGYHFDSNDWKYNPSVKKLEKIPSAETMKYILDILKEMNTLTETQCKDILYKCL